MQTLDVGFSNRPVAEHREILRQALAAEIEPSFDTLAAELRKLTKRRKQTPSEVLLRKGQGDRMGAGAAIVEISSKCSAMAAALQRRRTKPAPLP